MSIFWNCLKIKSLNNIGLNTTSILGVILAPIFWSSWSGSCRSKNSQSKFCWEFCFGTPWRRRNGFSQSSQSPHWIFRATWWRKWHFWWSRIRSQCWLFRWLGEQCSWYPSQFCGRIRCPKEGLPQRPRELPRQLEYWFSPLGLKSHLRWSHMCLPIQAWRSWILCFRRLLGSFQSRLSTLHSAGVEAGKADCQIRKKDR